MSWELQEWKGTEVHAVLGKPPEQGLPEEAGKSWWERRKEVGTRPRWRPRTCRQGGRRCESRRRGPSEVQVSRALCRLWGLHWGGEECMQQQGNCAGCTGSVDDGVGHHGRLTLRGVEEMGKRCRSHPSRTSMQVNDEGETSRRTWISSNDPIRGTAPRLGASFGGRREPHCRTNCYFVRLCTREWRNLFVGKPLGQLLVVASSDEAPHGQRNQSGGSPVCLWMRKQESYRDPHNIFLDEEGVLEVWGHTSSRACGPRGQRLELCIRPSRVGLENFDGRRISCGSLLGLGPRAEVFLGGGVHPESTVGSKLQTQRRERHRKKQEEGDRSGLAGAEGMGKPTGLGRPQKSVPGSCTDTCNVGRWPFDEGGSFESIEKELSQTTSWKGGEHVWALRWPGPGVGSGCSQRARFSSRNRCQRGSDTISFEADKAPVGDMQRCGTGRPSVDGTRLSIGNRSPIGGQRGLSHNDGRHEGSGSIEDFRQAWKRCCWQRTTSPFKMGYATWEPDWTAVTASVGAGAALTKLGCIQKEKPDGSIKTRLIVDMRRSGINGKMTIRQRVVLPRVTEVVTSWQQLAAMYTGQPLTMAVIDFKDAFYTCRLSEVEKKYAVVQGRKGFYILNVVAFGLACGPLLWGRTAAVMMRLAAAMLPELRLQCYVDDPMFVLSGHDDLQHRMGLILACTLWQALGSDLAWGKLQFGTSVSWIGFQLQLQGSTFVATLAPDKLKKLQGLLQELRAYKGMLPLAKLRTLAGVLGWLTSIIIFARPWVSMIWGAITEAEQRQPKNVRQTKNVASAATAGRRLRAEGNLPPTAARPKLHHTNGCLTMGDGSRALPVTGPLDPMSLAEGHSCLHAAQAFIQWNQLRIPGSICQAPSLCQDLHLVRPDQLNHRHETGKAGWAGRESFDSRSAVLSFKPLTGGLSQNGTTFSLIETLLPTGSLPTKISVCLSLCSYTPRCFTTRLQQTSINHPHPTTLGNKTQLHSTEHFLFLLKLVEVAGSLGVHSHPCMIGHAQDQHWIGPNAKVHPTGPLPGQHHQDMTKAP